MDNNDENFDYVGLENAAAFIGMNLRILGRVNVIQFKEKFQTCRVYCNLGWSCLLNITNPGYQYYRYYPKWLMTLDIYVLSRIIPYLNYVVVPYHKWLYRKLYSMAIQKWPHLKQNILSCSDYSELLKGL